MQMLFELSWQQTCVWGIFTAFTNVYDDWIVYNIIKKCYLFWSFLLLPHLAVFEHKLLLLLTFMLLTFHLFLKITIWCWWVFGGMSFQMTSHVHWLIQRFSFKALSSFHTLPELKLNTQLPSLINMLIYIGND